MLIMKKPIDEFKFVGSGIFFKSESDNSTTYTFTITKIDEGTSALIDIWTNKYGMDNKTGDYIDIPMCDFICEVLIYAKYFFPTFKKDIQMYYDDSKHYNNDNDINCSKTDSVISLMECVNYAIDYGLKEAKIKPN